jgi:putative polymerase
LCFLNTHIAPIQNSHVIGAELLLIVLAILVCAREAQARDLVILLLIVVYTVALALIRAHVSTDGTIDLKTTRDFLIPVIFFMLGRSTNDIRFADRLVYAATLLVLAFAIFEYLFVDSYLKLLGVVDYYVARGSLDPLKPSLQWAGGLMLNGIRPEELGGRALLPFFGDHRVSSLFLESISLGNFGSLIIFWGIARSRMQRQLYFWLIVAGIALIVLSDSRFNASFLAIGILILLLSPRITTPAVLAMPFVALFGLNMIAADVGSRDVPFLEGQSLFDRLVYSGRVLANFDAYNWLGIAASRADTLDAGYAYVVSSVGLLGLAAFWFWFMSLEGRSRYFYAFRNTSAAYFAALFCVSTSAFTIKTGALLWFLIGTLSLAKDQERLVPRARQRKPKPVLETAPID